MWLPSSGLIAQNHRVKLFLSGPMGAGKSTVGAVVASRLAVRFIDLDAEITREAGISIAELFRSEGEPAFRRREARLIASLSAESNIVIALGGGTVCDLDTRDMLFERGVLLTLMADIDVLLSRVGGAEERPLLAGDSAARLGELLVTRAAAYGECHARIDASGSPSEVADACIARLRDRPMAVRLGARSYTVDVGRGLLTRLPTFCCGAEAGMLQVADTNTARYAAHDALVLPAGEAHKNLSTVSKIWDHALERRIDRNTLVVGIGGGVVGDMTGFAAATLLRGVPFALVATSIVAMVDSSVGGKTGFDRPQGKNLVGAFASATLCSLRYRYVGQPPGRRVSRRPRGGRKIRLDRRRRGGHPTRRAERGAHRAGSGGDRVRGAHEHRAQGANSCSRRTRERHAYVAQSGPHARSCL